jgi:hypothetical protein
MTCSKSKIVPFGAPGSGASFAVAVPQPKAPAHPKADAIMAAEARVGTPSTRDALETAPAHVARHRWILFVMDEICEYADKYQLPETAEALRKVILTAEAEIIGKRN